jgi:bacteriocin biosynthesis cyclodehydratase domain-containing protein
VRLRQGLAVLWRSPTEVQVGTDPRWAVSLADLSPSAVMALQQTPSAADARTVRAALTRESVARSEAEAVVDHLRAARLLVQAPPAADSSPDAAAWSLLSPTGAGQPMLTRRSRASVRVSGLGRVGSPLAALLASAGVGTVDLDDPGLVSPADVGAGGLLPRDVGTSRATATARALHDVAPAVRTSASSVDLVVLVEDDVADPLRYRPLLDADTPHLSVVVREASVLVGPLVRPGRSACLRCVDLHRTDLDPAWPALAAQLAGRGAPRAVETTLAATATAVAAAQVLAHLDGRPTSVDDASVEIRLPDVMPRLLAWPPHHACDCAGPPAPGTGA